MADKPERLDARYTLWEKIASGGMADVYRATEYGAKGSSKTVALKKILPSFSSNPDYRKMFIDEGIIGSQLTHANICQVNPLIEIGENLYIPMEYIEGKNLRQVINKYKKKNGAKPLPIPFTLYVMNEVFKGLDYAHSASSNIGNDTGKPLNIVHRDMSPQNIMLSYQGGVKLIDFGIAKAKILTNETRAGVIKGKYSYMSPEQAMGQSLGPQSDIFSTGIVLWEMLTGERLFQSDNDMATLKAIQDCDLKNLEPIKKNPEVTSELNKLVMKLLTKDLSLRFKSADQAQQNLQKYINEKFSAYSTKNVKKFLQDLFAEDIIADQKRAQELFATTLPNSQQRLGSTKQEQKELENDGIDQALDGSLTSTEISQSIGVTQTDASGIKENFELKKDLESDSDSDSDSEADPTILEVSHKTSVSIEAESFKIPTIFGDENPAPTRFEGSVTKAGNSVASGIKLDISTGEINKNKENEIINQEEPQFEASLSSSSHVGSQNPLESIEAVSRSKASGTVSKNVDIMLENSDTATNDSSQQVSSKDVAEPQKLKESPRWVAYGAVLMVFGLGYIYKLIFTGEIFPSPTRPPAANNPSVNQMAPIKNEEIKTEKLLCQVQVDTDPPGADIVGENFTGNSSTGTISAPCDRAVIIRIEKQGYEPVRVPVDTSAKSKQVISRVVLQPLKEGSVVLTVDNNAKVEIDGRLVGEVKANVPTEFRLAPGVRRFTFTNEVLGVQAVKQIQVLDKEKRVENETIKLSDIKP